MSVRSNLILFVTAILAAIFFFGLRTGTQAIRAQSTEEGRIVVDKVTNPAGDLTFFDFQLTDVPTGTLISAFGLQDVSAPYQSPPLDPDVYAVTEDFVPPNWELTSASCTSDNSTPNDTTDDTTFAYVNGGVLILDPGAIITCTFTNTLAEAPPSIVVTKTANPTSVSEPGGSVDFTVSVQNTSDPTDPVTITSLADDIHGDLNGQGDCSAPQTIQPGDTYVCTFSAVVSGNPGDSETDTVTVAGTDDDGMPVSDSDDAVVTITNNNIAPTLTLIKTVVNDDGGTLGVSDFPLFIDGNPVTSGVLVELTAGDYMASETQQLGYTASAWGGDCDASGNVTLGVGENKTCTITNDDIAASCVDPCADGMLLFPPESDLDAGYFPRGTGKPSAENRSFNLEWDGDVCMNVTNNGCASTTITLDGEEFISPDHFNPDVERISAIRYLPGLPSDQQYPFVVTVTSIPSCSVEVEVRSCEPN